MAQEIFLIDSNSFITPHNQYYPFDFAPGFWDQLKDNIACGNIAILDMVKSEILHGNDDLMRWMGQLEIGNYIDHRKPEILERYGQVLSHIQNNPAYKPAALEEWSRDTVADPWLISAASAYNLTLVTFERRRGILTPASPCKNAKIPDVADVFGVKTVSLYYMMRNLGFKLK